MKNSRHLNRKELTLKLETIARKARYKMLEALCRAGSGHTGGSLSCMDLLVALFFHEMKHKPQEPGWKERDRFVLSKGHAAPALYTVLAMSGYFRENHLSTLRKLGEKHLQGHPDRKSTVGVEVSTGSLGQGLSIGIGIALGARIDSKNIRVFVLTGDGELQEGQIWEAAMFAGHRSLDNLVTIVDYNGLQIDGYINDIVTLEPLAAKWKDFGWRVLEINGHDYNEILDALEATRQPAGKPTVIIAKTVKGKGVSIFEGKAKYHGIAPTAEELEIARKELLGDGTDQI